VPEKDCTVQFTTGKVLLTSETAEFTTQNPGIQPFNNWMCDFTEKNGIHPWMVVLHRFS
jgi:hypothetical protein